MLNTFRPDQYIVTHFAAYFHDPEAELRRVLKFLGASVSDRVLRNAARTISATLKHQTTSSQRRLPDALEIRYALLTEKAGPIFRNVAQPRPVMRLATFVEPADAVPLSAVQSLMAQLRTMARTASRLDAVEYRAQLRAWLIPHRSQRLRAYFLVTSTLRSLRREGITASARRVIGWLGGERRSLKKRKP